METETETKPHAVLVEHDGGPFALHLLAVCLLFVFPIGTIASIAFFIWMASISERWFCSECHNRIFGPNVRICPVCKATLHPPPTPEPSKKRR